MRTTAIISAVLILSGCSAQKVAQDYQRDSVRVETIERTIYKDSVIYVPVPSGESSAVLPDSDTSRLETLLAKSEAFVKNGQLHHSLKNRQGAILPVDIKLPTVIMTKTEAVLRDRKVVELVEVEKQLSRWQAFLQTVGGGVLAAAALWLLIWLVKMFR